MGGFDHLLLPEAHVLPPEAGQIPSKHIIGRSKGEMGECCRSVVLDFCSKCAAALGQEGEVVAAAVTHIKAKAAKFGLRLVFCSVWEAHHWKMWHASGSVQNLARVINFGNPLLYFH